MLCDVFGFHVYALAFFLLGYLPLLGCKWCMVLVFFFERVTLNNNKSRELLVRQKSLNVDTMSNSYRLFSSFSHLSLKGFYASATRSYSSAMGQTVRRLVQFVFLIVLNTYAFSRGVVIGHAFLLATLGVMAVRTRSRRQSLLVECIAGLRLAFPRYALELLSIIALSNYFYPAALFGLNPITLGCVVLDFVFLTNKNLMLRLVPDVQAGASVFLFWQAIVSRGYDWMKSLIYTGSKPEVSTGKIPVPSRTKNGRSLNDPLSANKKNSDKSVLGSAQPFSPQGGSVSPDLSSKTPNSDVETVAGQAYKSPPSSPLRLIESQLLNELQVWQQTAQDSTASSEQPKIDELISYVKCELMDGIHRSLTDVGVEGDLQKQLADCGADEASFIHHVARRFLAQVQLSSVQKQRLGAPRTLFLDTDNRLEDHATLQEDVPSESESDSDEEQDMPGTAGVLQTVQIAVSDVIDSAVTRVVAVGTSVGGFLSPSRSSGQDVEDFQVLSTKSNESEVQTHELFSTPASSIHSPARSSRSESHDGDTEISHEFADAIIGHVDSGASESCDDQGFIRDVPSTDRSTSGMKTGSSDDENGLFCDAPSTVLSTSGVKTGGSDDHDPVAFDDIDYELGQNSGGIGNPGSGQLN